MHLLEKVDIVFPAGKLRGFLSIRPLFSLVLHQSHVSAGLMGRICSVNQPQWPARIGRLENVRPSGYHLLGPRHFREGQGTA